MEKLREKFIEGRIVNLQSEDINNLENNLLMELDSITKRR